MIIQHNMEASMANRCLDINQKKLKVSSQRLASGYRINAAADDAAGLKISEKMRAQIRGLNRASDNLGEGIALVQTADGALQEVHAMLQRMVELSVQAGNDTNDAGDRFAIQQEIDELRSEINRISTDTEYNNIKIFKATNIPDMTGHPNDIMIYHEDSDTDPRGWREAGIFYNGTRYPYSNMNLKYDENENIVAGTYPVQFGSEDGTSTTIELIFDGGNRVPSGRQYTLIPDKKGISIDNILHSWESIGIDPSNIQAGTYSFKHAGITFTFDAGEGLDLDSLIEELYRDGLTTYQLRSADWKSEKVDINPYITIYHPKNGSQLEITPANSHFIPGNTNSNASRYEMDTDKDKQYIYLKIPADQNQLNNRPPEQYLTPSAWDDDLHLTEWMEGGQQCINPGSGWDDYGTINPKPEGGFEIIPGANEGTHVKNGEQYRVYKYHDSAFTHIMIDFTIDSEVSRNELETAINNWRIGVETTTEMKFSCSNPSSKYNISFGTNSHSPNLDAYGTQYNMNLCQIPRKGVFLLKDTSPSVSGNVISFTMEDKNTPPKLYPFTADLSSIRTNVNAQLDSLAERFRRKIEQNLNNGRLPDYQLPSSVLSQTETLHFTSGDYWVDLNYTPDLKEFLNLLDPADTDIFTTTEKIVNNKKVYEVSLNPDYKSKLSQKITSLVDDIKNSLASTKINIQPNEPIYANLSIVSPEKTDNIRYSTQVISGTREIKIQSSDNAWDHIKIELPGMNSSIIGISNLDVSSYAAASASIGKIHNAINIISGMRSHFGALQNRMEAAMAVDDIMAENTQAAESRIRDADMANESLEFTKHSILNQAAQAVLAQSNHSKEGILSLLQ